MSILNEELSAKETEFPTESNAGTNVIVAGIESIFVTDKLTSYGCIKKTSSGAST
jgi:hypothetical protein